MSKFKKINFKLLLGSLILSMFLILILNMMMFIICIVPELLEAFNNGIGGNIKGYTFNLTRNSILLVGTTIIMYYLIGGMRNEDDEEQESEENNKKE